jgi:hypothetical protein
VFIVLLHPRKVVPRQQLPPEERRKPTAIRTLSAKIAELG